MRLMNFFPINLLVATLSFAWTSAYAVASPSHWNDCVEGLSLRFDISGNPSGNITTTFKVAGNCGMCKKRIEAAAKSVKGVKSAEWDGSTEMLTIMYNEKKTDLMEVHKKIAAAGYDTELVQATDDAYNHLHGCCHYERLQYEDKNE